MIGRAVAAAIAALVVGAVAGGCGPVSAPSGNEARIQIDASEEVAVRMVVSRLFGPSAQGGTPGNQVLVDGDTVWVDLPVNQSYDISEHNRFFIEIMDADPDHVPVNLQVWIDERHEFDHARALSEGILRYVFVRNH